MVEFFFRLETSLTIEATPKWSHVAQIARSLQNRKLCKEIDIARRVLIGRVSQVFAKELALTLFADKMELYLGGSCRDLVCQNQETCYATSTGL